MELDKICEVSWRFGLPSSFPNLVTLHLQSTSTIDWGGGDGQAMADALSDPAAGKPGALFAAVLTPNDSLVSVKVQGVRAPGSGPGGLHTAETIRNIAGTGTAGDAKVPEAACCVVTKNTALAGRRYRGRLFMPGPQNSAYISGNNWLSGGAYLTAVDAFVAYLSTLRRTSGSHPATGILADKYAVVFSAPAYLSDGSHRGTDVTAFLRRQTVHWLRSRRPIRD